MTDHDCTCTTERYCDDEWLCAGCETAECCVPSALVEAERSRAKTKAWEQAQLRTQGDREHG